jgi:hypothetical protein
MTVSYPDKVNLSEYRYIALNMKTESNLNEAGFFFGTGKATGVVASSYSKFLLMQGNGWHKYVCGSCDGELELRHCYCPECGQELDWSEE